ncbi:type I-C CRISPR-associated protein Cas8c/Csd1 [Metabacillus iocasae]|uniref:CRISPR-associated protein Csd1 n=1 Tax=Priestia iocasae TaxID=2291674 RepID=A0ABS2QTU8_9BACI|nr:type I-C CRISPR-associated protein Cas8c/Csd1 [Metabacillus iocasae]MBM7702895.1 CRISPR-associated protein Csd1 [Metabacillus iocasae]
MSWLLNLYETYEANIEHVGKVNKKRNGQEYTLLPIAHTTQTAHIQVNITEEGEFHSAFVIDKSDGNTLIPCTEGSSSRAGSKIAPYPLHDKLNYVAGDFIAYGGKIKKEEPFSYYIKNLSDWANSPYATNKVKSIYSYLNKKRLVRDLLEERILGLDENGELIEKWQPKYDSLYEQKPAIFSVIPGDQSSAFIRFNVHSPMKILKNVWSDQQMYESFIQYYRERLGESDLCFVTGKHVPSTDRHANKIRHAGDKAKLISANDTSGFTFRGRFHHSEEVASIGYDVSQKAHNALKWLIQHQGKVMDQRVFLVWQNNSEAVPDPLDDPFAMNVSTIKKEGFTNKEFAREVAKALDGYRNDLTMGGKADVNILILDSATTGRMAVLYYRYMNKELYLNRLKSWYSSCIWHHRYRKDENNQYIEFIGAPSPKDIALAAYGTKVNEKIVKGLVERILPCIIDDKKIPVDIVRSAIQRASNPVSMERWEWEKTISVTCALVNKEEGYEVSLDRNNHNRDYLFGRLLAIADVLERQALGKEETRATNAIRYMNSFSKHPARTWKTIQDALQPYQAKLGAKSLYLSSLIDEVASQIQFDDFNNKSLSGKYLLGFYSQRHDLYQKKVKDEETKAVTN